MAQRRREPDKKGIDSQAFFYWQTLDSLDVSKVKDAYIDDEASTGISSESKTVGERMRRWVQATVLCEMDACLKSILGHVWQLATHSMRMNDGL
ncbi:hypothetical protein CVT25_006010 [Psilocybe cyanescens]|uniref:Uncharacterized protein n=1 Tax=Psilocybe cyanescens TaxID=93625 RepID=A0A409VME7_PSICY|nr:hypothetical protein CVT25_006010 [Psilocybe cyanescens]